MDLSDKITHILGLAKMPAEKVGLIGLLIYDKPATTAELNTLLNCHKTFENYSELFEEEIQSGLIKLYAQKDYRGVKRQHFVIDEEVLEDLISNN